MHVPRARCCTAFRWTRTGGRPAHFLISPLDAGTERTSDRVPCPRSALAGAGRPKRRLYVTCVRWCERWRRRRDSFSRITPREVVAALRKAGDLQGSNFRSQPAAARPHQGAPRYSCVTSRPLPEMRRLGATPTTHSLLRVMGSLPWCARERLLYWGARLRWDSRTDTGGDP